MLEEGSADFGLDDVAGLNVHHPGQKMEPRSTYDDLAWAGTMSPSLKSAEERLSRMGEDVEGPQTSMLQY